MNVFLSKTSSCSLAFAVAAMVTGCTGSTTENTGSSDNAIQANCNLLDANSQGFEGGVGEWAPWYSTSIARSTAAAEAGSASLLVSITAPYGWGIEMNDWPGLPASPGSMNVSFWAKHDAGT